MLVGMLTNKIEDAAFYLMAWKEATGRHPSCTPREALDMAKLPTDDQWLALAEQALKGSAVFKKDPSCCGCDLHFCLSEKP